MMSTSMPPRFPLLFLVPLVLLAGCTTFTARRDDYVYQEVFFLTTREDTGEPVRLEERYTANRGRVAFGLAMVAIDPRGSLSRFASPQPNHVLEQSSLQRNREIQQLAGISEADFIRDLARYRSDSGPPQEVLVFIHGYKRTFADCISNAAHLRHELAFPGPVIAFSWPSTNSISGYLADIENLDWSEPALSDLIRLVSRSFPGARIHLIAHSLGNRALINTLSELVRAQPDLSGSSIGEIVFMAPDFDREIFINSIAGQLAAIPARKTLYVSAEDFPLMTSARLFQYPRLGDSSEGIPVVPGVETVDVSDAISLFNGHGYYETDPATIEDLYHLVREGQGARQRSHLVEVGTENGPYWRLLPRSEPE